VTRPDCKKSAIGPTNWQGQALKSLNVSQIKRHAGQTVFGLLKGTL